jgi:hypothetical protein
MEIDQNSSYAPKKTNPPMEIHVTLGSIPFNDIIRPSSQIVLLPTSIAFSYATPYLSFPIMVNLVLITSSGGVSLLQQQEPHSLIHIMLLVKEILGLHFDMIFCP